MKNLAIIGSTGSIGTQSIDLAMAKGYRISALACGSNIDLAEQQIRQVKPAYAAVFDPEAAKILKARVADTETTIEGGEEAVLKAASFEEANMVINAATGIAGLKPSLAAINSCKALALANKESLVCAGSIVMNAAKEKNVPILPVDSEHSAIFQCLQAGRKEEVDRLILTASGGPFFGWDKKMLGGVRAKDALKHPTWSMGSKITIDSSTMMNKGFEVIEAAWLFDIPATHIDVVVHRESIIHSAVKFIDGSVIAQMGNTDMRLPIQYAVNYPERVRNPFDTLDIFKLSNLSFYAPDRENFPCLALCEWASEKGGNIGAVINGANEIAVAAFLRDEIGFLDIHAIVSGALEQVEFIETPCFEDILESDRLARAAARKAIQQKG